MFLLVPLDSGDDLNEVGGFASGVRLARGGDGLVQLGGSCGTGFVKGGGGLFEAILGEVPDVTALGTLQRLPGHGGGRSRILNG